MELNRRRNEQIFWNDRRRYPVRHIEQRLVEESIRIYNETGQHLELPETDLPPKRKSSEIEYSGMLPPSMIPELLEYSRPSTAGLRRRHQSAFSQRSRWSDGPSQRANSHAGAATYHGPVAAEHDRPSQQPYMPRATAENHRPMSPEAQMEQADPDYIYDAMPMEDAHSRSWEILTESHDTEYPNSDGTST
ncbi:hypothetical protein M409DRAFT_20297 [Zasmidium cellare ATCC 36951]|uniref:Uncharacterized protein n=1 Tax=Zasmidium cellare ATCC 36951 TaxID=1080233 RepID=A0A6A6CT49_ZASCE|nr:uncharacterized protein M409DRAFT_20297 [Zasmidium cellare ATCC 36951]KAF2169883.1 hypothetical protein M409DRAFT_20297 [Zasmidium cellare ATCC 36951]